VAPATLPRVRIIAEALTRAGAGPYALFVVPRFHGQTPIEADADFLDWLRDEQGRGHEVVLHGLEHRNRRPRRGWQGWFFQSLYTNAEGECYGLSEPAFESLLDAGLEAFRGAGLEPPRGFVAPAWLMPAFAPAVLARHGFGFSETLTRVLLVRRGVSLPSPCHVFSSRSRLRTVTSVLWCRLTRPRRSRAPWLRVAFHPVDADRPAALRELLACCTRELGRRRVSTYRELEESFAPAPGAAAAAQSSRPPLLPRP
jgi:hypothetical protein